MKCNNCGKKVPEDSSFCPYCGNKLLQIKTCEVCGYETTEEFVYCPKCGNRLESDNKIDFVEKHNDSDEKVYADFNDSETTIKHNASDKPKKLIKKKVNNKLKKFKNNIKTIERIAIAVIALVLFICSFFSVIELNLNEAFESNYSSVKAEGDIKYSMSAASLVDFTFFSITLNQRNAEKYIADYSYNDILQEAYDVLTDRKYIEYENNKAYITNAGCRKISSIISRGDLLKASYASQFITNEKTTQNSMINYKIAGFFCLIFILTSFVTFALSLLSIFKKKDFAQIPLLLILLAMVIVITSLLTGVSGSYKWQIGGAYIAIVVFLALVFAYKFSMNTIENKSIEWYKIASGLTCVLIGIITVCMFAQPAVNITLSYTQQSTDNDLFSQTVDFEYGYTYSDLFEEYFDDTTPQITEIQKIFTENAPTFANNFLLSGDEFFKQQIGINGLMYNSSMVRYYDWLIVLCKIQPFTALISLILSAALLCGGIASICGASVYKKFRYVALAIILCCAIFSIILPIVMQVCIRTMTYLEVGVSAGSGVIVTLIFAILGIIGCALTVLLKNKVSELLPSKNNTKNIKVIRHAVEDTYINESESENRMSKNTEEITTDTDEMTTEVQSE